MPVSTRRMKARWPPTIEFGPDEMLDAANDTADTCSSRRYLILPNDLYWDYVRPYTPRADRSVLDKRSSGATRFYGGDRVKIDEAMLQTYVQRIRPDGAPPSSDRITVYRDLPRSLGDIGASNFRIYFQPHYQANGEVTDPAVALTMLREARAAWDNHMSRLASPADRLRTCLEMLCDDDAGGACPLLFPEEGTVRDVISYHVSMNPNSIDGPLGDGNFPNTQLGYWIDRYLLQAGDDMALSISSCITDQMEDIVDQLLKAGSYVTPFFEPIFDPPSGRWSYPMKRYWRSGWPIIGCLEEWSASYSHTEDEECTCFHRLNDIIRQLRHYADKGTNRAPLRFAIGSRVKCRVAGRENKPSWEKGIVVGHWYRENEDGDEERNSFYPGYYAPYQVELDVGNRLIWAPRDTDDCIRSA